jgi:hypothetical protein
MSERLIEEQLLSGKYGHGLKFMTSHCQLQLHLRERLDGYDELYKNISKTKTTNACLTQTINISDSSDVDDESPPDGLMIFNFNI